MSISPSSSHIPQQVTWDKITSILQRELSEQTYKTWFSPVSLGDVTDQSVTLLVPDSYFGQWIKNHYHEILNAALEEVLGQNTEIIYQTRPALATSSFVAPEALRPKPTGENKDFGLNANYTFESFVPGPGNRFAYAAALAVSEAPAKQYNPLFIHGPVGLGKTHLMQAIANRLIAQNPASKVLYISSEKFTNQLISAIQTRSTQQFRAKYRSVDLLLIDDIHFIAEKEATQEEFFHTFNTLYDAHKQIVVSSDRPPKEIPGLEERLVSRFAWGLITDIQPPDFETRVAILKKKMEKETVSVSDDVAYFIAGKIKSNIRELEGALIRVVAYGTLTKTPITLSLAQEILKDSFKEEEKKISIEQIQRCVAKYFNIKISDLRSKSRSQSIAFPRQISMFLVRTMTAHSLPEIGSYFGGRDHSTVLHAVNKIEDILQEKPEFQKTIQDIKDLLIRGD